MTDDVTHLRALLAEQTARAERAEADYRRVLSERAEANQLAGRCAQQRDQALAACAELRAALEIIASSNTRRLGESRRAIESARALLARTDLGRGMVMVPRERLTAWRDVLQRLPRAGWGYTDAERAAVADLDALLKKGGG